MSGLAHLARRFFTSLSPRPPNQADAAWAEAHLEPAEAAVWREMGKPDRRHSIEVARSVVARLGEVDASRAVVAGALLHDCGKLDAGLGTFGRVGATVWIAVAGRHRAERGTGRVARYARHEPLGAARLEAAGSDPITVALVARSRAAAAAALAALGAADDAI